MKIEYVLTDIQELTFKKQIEKNTELEIQTKSSYVLHYKEDYTSCIGELCIEVVPVGNDDKLQIRYRSNSLFNLDGVVLNDEEKKELHIETYKQLFPLCSNHVKSFLSMIGLPNIQIHQIDFSKAGISFKKA